MESLRTLLIQVDKVCSKEPGGVKFFLPSYYYVILGKLSFHTLEIPIFEKHQKHRHLFYSDQKPSISKFRDQKSPIISSAPQNSLNIHLFQLTECWVYSFVVFVSSYRRYGLDLNATPQSWS
jgi:hypothetical protein